VPDEASSLYDPQDPLGGIRSDRVPSGPSARAARSSDDARSSPMGLDMMVVAGAASGWMNGLLCRCLMVMDAAANAAADAARAAGCVQRVRRVRDHRVPSI